MKELLTIRKASTNDVESIHHLLELYAPAGIVLSRTKEDINFFISNFTVAVYENKVCGCAAVRDFGNDLLEVRSLAIQPDLRKSGIGRKLVEKAIARLDAERGTYRLFALTLQPGFFERLNFKLVEKELFPEKIWADCVHCPKQHCCDEYAVIYNGSK